MALCELGEKKTLIIILVVLQLLMVTLIGRFFFDEQSLNLKYGQKRMFGSYSHKNRTGFVLKTELLHQRQRSQGSSREVPSTSQLYSDIENNVVFKNFDVFAREKRERTNLLLIVSSAPKRVDRRNAIRETWWPLCKDTPRVKVKCIFMTDWQEPGSKLEKPLRDESAQYKDLELQKLGGGVEFGKRFLYHMLWAVRNFEFDYFMRLDDDYFLCFDKVVNELPMPRLDMFHWGWVHCIDGITRPEESIIIFSYDVVEKFLRQDPEKMRCHPWADQQIGLWVEDLGWRSLLKWRHDPRLHHDPPTRNLPNILNDQNVCQRLGYHGSYPETMRTLWQHRGHYELKKETMLQTSRVCQSNLIFGWADFNNFWRYEPKPCKENPVWDTGKQGGGTTFGGRQEGLGRKKRSLLLF